MPIARKPLSGAKAGRGLLGTGIRRAYLAGPPFTPVDISGLVAWYRNDTAMFQNTTGTLPCTTDGQQLSNWSDQSGNDYDATNPTANQTYQHFTYGAKTFVEGRFTGGGYLDATAASQTDFERTSPFTFWGIIRPTGGFGVLQLWVAKQDVTNFRGWAGYFSTDQLLYFRISNSLTLYAEVRGNTVLTNTQPYVVVCRNTGAGSASGLGIWVNGVAETLTTLSDTLGSNTIQTTSNLFLASRDTGNFSLAGGIAECGIHSASLTTTEIGTLSTYLNSICGAF